MWDTHRSIDDTKEFLDRALSWRERATDLGYAIVLRESGKMIGSIGLHNYEPHNKCIEMGYVIAPPYWNKGYVTEAVRGLVKEVFALTDMNRIQAHHYLANDASGRVMEKAGMKYEGILRQRVFVKGEFRDIKLYAILRSDNTECPSPLREKDNGWVKS